MGELIIKAKITGKDSKGFNVEEKIETNGISPEEINSIMVNALLSIMEEAAKGNPILLLAGIMDFKKQLKEKLHEIFK